MRKNCLPSGFNRVPLIIETYINGAVDAVMIFTSPYKTVEPLEKEDLD